MALLNDADEVFVGTVQADRVYLGTTLVWPKVETWSPWMLVGSAPAAAPAAWFAANITHYPSGHQRVYWRYSLNTNRVMVKGIAISNVALGYGALILTLNINPAIVPKTNQRLMSHGLSGVDYVGTWAGSMTRLDLVANATYHSDILMLFRTDANFPAGGWFTFESTWAFGDDR